MAQDLRWRGSDVVDQGVGTLRELAQDQVGSESWDFWWD
ncbi:DUF4253 domain-containing protein [Cellulomonas phragmiteti]|nr:DUF4253 domain-containing protein [Cellulomonas phragmiteti]